MRLLIAADRHAMALDGEVYASLVELGVDVQIVVTGRPSAPAEAERDPMEVPASLAGRVHGSGSSAGGDQQQEHRATPGRWVRELAADVVLVDHGRSPLAAARWVGAATQARVPVAVAAAADEAPGRPGRLLQRRTLVRADGVFARTPAAARRAQDGGAPGAVRVVPPAVSERPSRSVSSDRSFTPGYVGPLSEDDGVADLLAAVDRLPRDTRLLIVGDGPLRAEAESRKGVDLQVEPGSTGTAAVYDGMDVLVVPSRGPSTSRALLGTMLDAMAGGTPVIGAATGDIPWVLSEVGGGMTFPPGDVGTLADLMLDVRNDRDRWRAAGERARSGVGGRFSPSASAAALLDLTERI